MSFQHVKIAGFLKDRTRPLFDGSKACRFGSAPRAPDEVIKMLEMT